MLQVKTKSNLNFPKLNFDKELKEIADRIIIPVIQLNIQNEQDIREQRYAPLSPAYVKQKQRKGLSVKILEATGKLKRSFYSVSRGSNKVAISLSSDRLSIGNILQNLGVGGSGRTFNFFGISTRMESLSIDYMKKKIGEKLNAG